MTIPDELRSALREFRAVRARKPLESAEASEFVDWHERMAIALQFLAGHLIHETDRVQARDAAARHREEATRIRQSPI
ncbi:hypothetical protein ABZ137_07925 [Streptomyces bobili]|uniref:hypothetical protein n=1 Tax=Streptomyces bobili TaxID=67280 RepID=UPI0033A1511F